MGHAKVQISRPARGIQAPWSMLPYSKPVLVLLLLSALALTLGPYTVVEALALGTVSDWNSSCFTWWICKVSDGLIRIRLNHATYDILALGIDKRARGTVSVYLEDPSITIALVTTKPPHRSIMALPSTHGAPPPPPPPPPAAAAAASPITR
ncbi:hypothetical protein S7711_10912 [Stachybotrys chartarum IBT 7711]|uniref:Uncharacterized protein n=1 Tax=Stachybotrys chartarum (strain CBS 109288 / IBT 7711) TaxID=1280523 RepID=A0A084AV22_STACB|nr:hypothetical protein S7711_10912 [Stachybotrys chartarum IBT 7711]KFA53209.1 hypothetical protein S40293_10678 [Stachybotrys chartarum IBT 40293]